MMHILREILNRILETNKGKSLVKLEGIKEAYMEPVTEQEPSEENMWHLRLMMRNYFRELNLYSKFT